MTLGWFFVGQCVLLGFMALGLLSVRRRQRKQQNAEAPHVHKWGKWARVDVQLHGDGKTQTVTGQRRFCDTCGYKQIERNKDL